MYMRAMLFAAGLGTRLRPLTDHMPKALVPVSGRPLLDITIERLKMAGATDIVVNVHHFSSQIIDHLAQHDYGVRIRVSDETAELLDTGGGLKKALPLFEGDAPVLLHNVDILSNADLRAFCRENAQNDVTLLVSTRQTQRYLLFDAAMRLVGWTNIATGEVRSPYPALKVSDCRMLAFSGIHLVRPDALRSCFTQWPARFPIMDFYLQNCHELRIQGVENADLRLLDVGKQQTLATAEEFLKTGF